MELTINAKKRNIEGKQVKSVRQSGFLPAVLFGKGQESQSLQIPANDFLDVYSKAGESSLINLYVDDIKGEKKISVLVDAVQYHPVSRDIIHASLRQIDLKEKIKARIPIEFTGESPAVKSGDGIFIFIMDELEVECLPTDLPPKIIIDISKLEKVDDAVFVKDISLDFSKVEVLSDKNDMIAKIDYAEMQEEKVEEISEAEAIEKIEAIAEKKESESEETPKNEGPAEA
jgi:large subunit ribosomal protein L25